MTLRWKVYYGDGSTFSSADGHAFDTPARGVQIIAIADHEHGWRLERGGDYYCWVPGKDDWYAADQAGLILYFLDRGPKRVLLGERMDYYEYRAVLDRAMSDTALPTKTGWQPSERGT